MKKLVEENNRSRLRHEMFAKYSRNHLQDRLLQIDSKGIENIKKEQEAPKAKTLNNRENMKVLK